MKSAIEKALCLALETSVKAEVVETGPCEFYVRLRSWAGWYPNIQRVHEITNMFRTIGVRYIGVIVEMGTA